MTAAPVTVEPLDSRRCTFTLAGPLIDAQSHRFRSPAEARGVPVIDAVFGVPGVTEVAVAGATLTVTKGDESPWPAMADRILYAIETAGHAARSEGRGAAQLRLSDDAMYDRITRIFAEEINPSVAKHGGRVELIDVQDGTVVLRMLGGCQGCGMASVTLRQGIESALRNGVPGFAGLADITDHASGKNPYFS